MRHIPYLTSPMGVTGMKINKCPEKNAGDTDGTKEELTNALIGQRKLSKKPLNWVFKGGRERSKEKAF